MGLYLALIATRATINRHQFPLLYVELFFLVHHPLVVAIAAQGLAFVLFFERGLTEWEYVSHGMASTGNVSFDIESPGFPHHLTAVNNDIVTVFFRQQHEQFIFGNSRRPGIG